MGLEGQTSMHQLLSIGTRKAPIFPRERLRISSASRTQSRKQSFREHLRMSCPCRTEQDGSCPPKATGRQKSTRPTTLPLHANPRLQAWRGNGTGTRKPPHYLPKNSWGIVFLGCQVVVTYSIVCQTFLVILCVIVSKRTVFREIM